MTRKVKKRYAQGDHNERGFSLIEMMIAATVITVGLIAVMGVSVYVSRANSTSNTLSVLATTAQDQVDAMRTLTWSQSTADAHLAVGGDVNYASADANHRTQITNTPAGDLNISWVVAAGPGATGDLRTVTIHVVQVNPPPQFANGVTVTMLISKN